MEGELSSMADDGLARVFFIVEADKELSSLEPNFGDRASTLDKSKGGCCIRFIAGERCRLKFCRSALENCCVKGTTGADEVLFSCRKGGGVGCCRSGLAAFGGSGVLVNAYGATGAVVVCPR